MPVSRPQRAPRVNAVLLLLWCLLALSGCGKESSGQSAPAGGMPAPEVVVKTISRGDLPLNIEYMGQVTGSREVEVRARVGGILLKRAYVEGTQVRQGDLMFLIDPEPFKAALEQAQGALEQAEARLAQTKRDLERMRKLRQADVVSQKDADDAQTNYESATAEVRAAQGKVREARINLGYTRVEAPITGVTSKETRSEGSLVGTSADSSLLTVVNRIDPVYVNFSIPSAQAMKFRANRASGRMAFENGQDFEVRLVLADGSVYPLPGKVNFTDTQVDAQTGVVKARAEVPNPDGALMPGQFVRAKLAGAVLKQAMTIPQGAVLQTQQGAMVWVVNAQNMVEPRIVTLGETQGNAYLIESGLESGERIVVEGVIKVHPGAPVNPREAGAEPTAKSPAEAPAKSPDGQAG
ncbi:efflux RND transporter periplasmic adaptor subunit [Fundidesulfovibrio terrae]|uniref:efflux RND transporter periplasmic adaptor subunit n=1 Tax=Fundidesulfovibrio terrae TaxID=2922866 RepID=UPI001FAF146D|nr:efflux RND transporter periplasmic adaptor subunit [Fundidesulfovibrio terrae]